MNCIIYQSDTNTIKYFIKDCILQGGNFYGSNTILKGMKFKSWKYKWINESPTPIVKEGRIIGYEEKVSDFEAQEPDIEIKEPSDKEYKKAQRDRKFLSDLNFSQIEEQIDSLKNMKDVKEYLKKLSKVVLALSKIIDKEIK